MNATQYPPMCAQRLRNRLTDPVNLFKIHISEDCLYLNVFAPPQVCYNLINKFFLVYK